MMKQFSSGTFYFLAIISGWTGVVFCKPSQQIDDTAAEGVSNIVKTLNGSSPATQNTTSSVTPLSIFVNTTRPSPVTQNSTSTETFFNDFTSSSNNSSLIWTNQSFDILDNFSSVTAQQFHFPFLNRPTNEDLLIELRAAISTSTEQTPYLDIVAYNKQLKTSRDKNTFGLGYGSNCKVYGSEIKMRQETGEAFAQKDDQTIYTSKELDNEFPSKVCRISQRLECIPDKSADAITTTTPAPLPGAAPAPGAITDDVTTNPGVCRCLRALSDRSIFVPTDRYKKTKPGCYIPAGFAEASICGQVVPLPYGIIRTVGKNSRLPDKEIPIIQRHVGNSSLLCVPNADCRISSNFVGRRCVCRKDSKWHLNGTCEKIYTREELENIGYRLISTSTIAFLQTLISVLIQIQVMH